MQRVYLLPAAVATTLDCLEGVCQLRAVVAVGCDGHLAAALQCSSADRACMNETRDCVLDLLQCLRLTGTECGA